MTPTPFTHTSLRLAAAQLAAQINAGMYAGLTPDERCELRGLTIQLAAWADDVEAMEVPGGRVVSLRPALVAFDGGKAEVWR